MLQRVLWPWAVPAEDAAAWLPGRGTAAPQPHGCSISSLSLFFLTPVPDGPVSHFSTSPALLGGGSALLGCCFGNPKASAAGPTCECGS